jgi:hypothetical protein
VQFAVDLRKMAQSDVNNSERSKQLRSRLGEVGLVENVQKRLSAEPFCGGNASGRVFNVKVQGKLSQVKFLTKVHLPSVMKMRSG